MAERRFILSKPNYTAPVVDGSADLSGAKGSMKVEHQSSQYGSNWTDQSHIYDFTYELIDSNEGGTSTPIVLGESTNQYVTGYQASSDAWRGTSAEFIITATNPLQPDLTANFNIVVTDPYYEEPPAGLGSLPPPPPPPDPPDSDEGRTGEESTDTGEWESSVEYTTEVRVLEDILPSTPLRYNNEDLIITMDLRLITYKPSALAEIMNPDFKSY